MSWSAIQPKRSHYDTGGESPSEISSSELFAVSLDTCLKNEKENDNKHLLKLFSITPFISKSCLKLARTLSRFQKSFLQKYDIFHFISLTTTFPSQTIYIKNMEIFSVIIQLTWQLRRKVMNTYAS